MFVYEDGKVEIRQVVFFLSIFNSILRSVCRIRIQTGYGGFHLLIAYASRSRQADRPKNLQNIFFMFGHWEPGSWSESGFMNPDQKYYEQDKNCAVYVKCSIALYIKKKEFFVHIKTFRRSITISQIPSHCFYVTSLFTVGCRHQSRMRNCFTARHLSYCICAAHLNFAAH